MRFLFLVLFFLGSYFHIVGQTNSTPYKNTQLIKIHSNNYDLVDSLLRFNVVPISCRGGVLQSELIVDSFTLNWLKKKNISFSIIHHNVEEMINSEMEHIKNLKSKRSSNWFSVYRELDEIEDKIDEIVAQSNIVTKTVIGQSYEGRDVAGVKIGVDNSIEDKPAIFINGCQHAREWITPMATTYLIHILSEQYNTSNEVNTFLNEVDVYIVPIVNPDGYVYTWEEDRWWRKNRQLNDGWEDCVGTDLNRNWDIDWNGGQSTSESPCSYVYVGTAPFSAPETQIVSDYISSIPNLVSHIDIHSYSALIVAPWGFVDEPTQDNDEIFCLGTQMQSAVSNTHNYPYVFGIGTVNDMLYLVSGGMLDWVYNTFGSLAYLYELRPYKPICTWFNFEEVDPFYPSDCYMEQLEAFNNEEEEILETCEEFYQGFLTMLKWAYLENCEVATGCSDPEAENYYCNTPEGNMGCLLGDLELVWDGEPDENGAIWPELLYTYDQLPLGFIDDGSCVYPISIEEFKEPNSLIKTFDILGRETNPKGLFFQLYDDGKMEKKYVH